MPSGALCFKFLDYRIEGQALNLKCSKSSFAAARVATMARKRLDLRQGLEEQPPGLATYRISTPSPARSPPPPPPRDPSDGERDVFAKSDKWLPSLPTIDFALWKDRISEALGFLTWMEKLTSWVGLGSEVFPNELRHAVRTRDEAVLGQDRLTVEQQKRSIRLSLYGSSSLYQFLVQADMTQT